MMTKILSVAVAFICINLYGAVNSDYFGGFYTLPGGSFMSSGFPDEVHPKDCSPNTIRIEHITSILEIYEKNLRKGTLLDAIQASANSETFYLLSFVGDERFSPLIYEQYSDRLFEEFGDNEATAVLLYYRTGGSLEKLRSLYQQPVNDDVKKAIEACFFDASVGLLEKQEQDVADATPQPLSVKLSTQYRTRKFYTKDLAGEIPDDLFGGSEGTRYLQECTTDERDLIITYENTTENRLIRIEILRYGNENCWREFNVARSGGQPVLASGYLRMIAPERQFITLYPGDTYRRKIDVNFSVTTPGPLLVKLFSDFNRNIVVLGGYWVGLPENTFQVTLNYTCNYFTARSVGELDQIKDSDWRMVRTASLSLDYEPQTPVDSKSAMRTQQDKAWNSIMEQWKDIP